MEDVIYNILWIDDEHESLSGTKGRAKRNGINLIPFKSLNGGMSELEKNSSFYDGVLLDAKFFENEDDDSGSEDTYNVHRAKERLLVLKKKFEFFILTGQAEAYEDKTFKQSFNRVYKKGSDDEIDRLFDDIKMAAKNQVDTQIRQANIQVFNLCTDKYIGENTAEKLLKILKQIELNQEIELINSFNELRGILELLFGKLNSLQIIPDKIFKSQGWINQSSTFLSGKHSVYKWNNDINPIHPTICNLIYQFLKTVQDGSHEFPGQLQLKINDFVNINKTDFLYKSTLYQLLDILVYFKQFIDNYSNETENVKLWYEDNIAAENRVKAIVLSGNNGWGNVLLKDDVKPIGIPKPMMESNSLKVGDEIEFTPKYDENKERYHIVNIKKV